VAVATMVDAIRRLAVRVRTLRDPGNTPRCRHWTVRSEAEIHAVASQLTDGMDSAGPLLPSMLRDLVALNTPALFLNIIDSASPVHVVLQSWDGRGIRLRGRNYLLETGSQAPEGIEAFTTAPFSHTSMLYPTAPDHPLYVISIERQEERVYRGEIPSYLTHASIMVNGVLVARCERLLHERGAHVWRAA
jgi:hypothetical protein